MARVVTLLHGRCQQHNRAASKCYSNRAGSMHAHLPGEGSRKTHTSLARTEESTARYQTHRKFRNTGRSWVAQQCGVRCCFSGKETSRIWFVFKDCRCVYRRSSCAASQGKSQQKYGSRNYLLSVLLFCQEKKRVRTKQKYNIWEWKCTCLQKKTVWYDKNTDISKPAESGKEGPEGETTWPH